MGMLGRFFTAKGEVVRKSDTGIGVRFEGLSPDRESLIKRFVDRLRAD